MSKASKLSLQPYLEFPSWLLLAECTALVSQRFSVFNFLELLKLLSLLPRAESGGLQPTLLIILSWNRKLKHTLKLNLLIKISNTSTILGCKIMKFTVVAKLVIYG